MDSSHCSDRPVSYGSTSSSASSRDSHCSLGGRAMLGSTPERDRDSGAIRLELVPARQLEEAESERETPTPSSQEEADGGRKVAYVDRVVQEILETERTYVQDLRSIVQDYLECISNQARPLLGVEDRNSLFGNIREIYGFNRDLLHDLEKCNANPVAIAECFVAKSEEFHIYTQYCTNYPRSVAVLSECMRNKAVAKFLRERQESLKHSLPLGSYLLKPVQRILKYHLLLHEIATHLEKDSEMHEVVQEAIDTMQRVAWHINDMKRKHENTIRLQEIQSLLTNWQGPDLIGYGELVLEGTFRVQRVKNERTLFLFDKLLLITKKREETYTYKAHILCCNLMLVEVIPKEPLSFSVFHYKNPKLQHTVQAKSQQDKRTWIQHLKRLILENHPAKIPAKVRIHTLTYINTLTLSLFCPCSPEGQNRINLKEGPSPRRTRRKNGESHMMQNKPHGLSQYSVLISQTAKESLQMETVHTPILQVTSPAESQPDISQFLGTSGGHSVPNIWADHRVRRAMFPTRQKTVQIDDEEDIYQMFVPTENDTSGQDAESDHDAVDDAPGRPCSWHVEQTQTMQLNLPTSGSRVLRRASSVGETQSERQNPAKRPLHEEQEHTNTESSSNEISGSSSAEQLTIDDIENVYDNISYEELQAMGLIRKDQEVTRASTTVQETKPIVPPQILVSPVESESSSESNRNSGQEGTPFGTGNVQSVPGEENIYDTIVFRELPATSSETERQSKQQAKPGHLQSVEKDFTASQNSNTHVSEESKNLDNSKVANRPLPKIPTVSITEIDSEPITSDSPSQQSTADRMSEQVDEIWNDLENYIRNNEKKPDKLPAAFPVSGPESPRKRSSSQYKTQNSPVKSQKQPKSPNKVSKPPPKAQENKSKTQDSPSKLSSGSFRMDDEDFPPQKDPDLQGLFGGLDPSLLSPGLLLGGEAGDQLLDLGEKGKNRVFLMARQYSQKIKKANQLLKMKSMDHEPSCARLKTSKPKDLAAILEEKKQGGAAIGARIAGYSHLYEQVMFREPPSTTPVLKSSISIAGPYPLSSHSSPGLASSPSLPDSAALNADWLNCTYSNGELADFVSWPAEVGARCPASPQRRLTPATSVPALKNLPPTPSTPPNQRWSACVTPPSADDSEHIYSTLGQRTSKTQPYDRCQSSSSLAEQQEKENSAGRSLGPRQHSLPECPSQGISDLSQSCDLTLRDSQQVLVLNKTSPLNAVSATQNYLANFKDNGEDDDDYVEIRSEDESDERNRVSGVSSSSQLQSNTKGQQGSAGLDSALHGYMWNSPDDDDDEDLGQSKIVQSLRDKFQCLSSSSFA
uniref:Pleckstrin homology and RhoGEF domain containing G1 n=1 Tax=Astyanax mexicanus TaxID=7994 RepID=W5KU25_ASTMX